MRNARLVVVIGLVVVAGVVLWRCRSDDTTPFEEAGSTNHVGSAHARDPITGAPRWFGQPGVGGRQIAGLVVGALGDPIRGATVRLASKLTMSGMRVEPTATTDGAGRFDFGAQPAAAYVVAAEMPRLTGAIEYVDLRNGTTTPDQLRLVLHACDASIHGTIRDSAGGVVAGALVSRVGEQGITTKGGTEAGDSGAYELCVPAGGASVRVSADGYAAIFDQVRVFGRTRRDFALVPGATVVGRVVHGGDRAAVAGAIVELRSSDSQLEGWPLSATSDADGRFQFDGVAPGRHAITALAERLATARPVDVIAEMEKPAEVVCELVPTLTISGTVIEAGRKTPVAGVTVYMMSRSRTAGYPGARPLEAITQTGGSFAIDHVFAGEYQPWVQGSTDREHPPAKVTVVTVDVSDIVLETERGASISGRIFHDGKPIDGAQVNLRDRGSQTKSDHEGRYTLRGISAGTFQVYAESHRVGAFAPGPTVTVAAGEHKTGVDVVLDLSGSIAGVVVDQNDAPVGGVFLSFSLLRGRDFGLATTADDGTFTARSLSGGGDYAFEVRDRDGAGAAFPPVVGKRHSPIAVRDGHTHITDLRIKIRVERLAIAGRVIDAEGRPVPDVTVRAIAIDRRSYRMPTGTSDQSGAFAIRDLPPGKYTLQATSARGDASEDSVAAGRADIALRVQALGGIDGTLEGFAARPDVIAYSSDNRRAPYGYRTPHRAVVTGNTFQLRNLPAGEYHVASEVHDRDHMFTQHDGVPRHHG